MYGPRRPEDDLYAAEVRQAFRTRFHDARTGLSPGRKKPRHDGMPHREMMDLQDRYWEKDKQTHFLDNIANLFEMVALVYSIRLLLRMGTQHALYSTRFRDYSR